MLPTRPDTTLTTDCPRVTPILSKSQGLFKLHHARIGKQQCWVIVWHKRRAVDDSVLFGGKKIEECLAYFATIHADYNLIGNKGR